MVENGAVHLRFSLRSMEMDQTNEGVISTSPLPQQRIKDPGHWGNQRCWRKYRVHDMKSKKRNQRREQFFRHEPWQISSFVIYANNGDQSIKSTINRNWIISGGDNHYSNDDSAYEKEIRLHYFRSHSSIIARSVSSMSIMTTAAPSPPKARDHVQSIRWYGCIIGMWLDTAEGSTTMCMSGPSFSHRCISIVQRTFSVKSERKRSQDMEKWRGTESISSSIGCT